MISFDLVMASFWYHKLWERNVLISKVVSPHFVKTSLEKLYIYSV